LNFLLSFIASITFQQILLKKPLFQSYIR